MTPAIEITALIKHFDATKAVDGIDLTVDRGNPAEDISDIRRPVLVLKNGVRYVPEELYRAVGMLPIVRRTP